MTDYYVSTGNDDYTESQPDGGGYTFDYTSTTMIAERNNFVSPSMTRKAYFFIDTSGIPDGDTITAATLYVYGHSYTASKGVAKTYNIWMFDGSTWTVIKSGTFSAAGWISEVLTSTELNYINKTGTTNFFISVDDPGRIYARTFSLRTYEYGSYTPYLSVTHSAGTTYFYGAVINS